MGSLLGEVLQAKSQTNLDEITEIIDKVEGKIVHVKQELVASLYSCFVVDEVDSDRITSWSVEVSGIKGQVEGLVKEFSSQKEAYNTSAGELETVESQINQTESDISLLTTLVKIVKDLDKAEPGDDYVTASVLLKSSMSELKRIKPAFTTTEDKMWIQGLTEMIDDVIFQTHERACKDWNDVFRFNRNRLSVHVFGPKISSIIETLRNLGSLSRVWSRFINQLWTEILMKLCSPEYTLNISRPIIKKEIVQGSGSGSDTKQVREFKSPRSLIQVDKNEGPKNKSSIKVQTVFANILDVLTLLAECFDKPEIMIEIGKDIGPKLCEALSSKCLKTLILENSDGDIEAVQKDIADLNKFRADLKALNFSIPQDDERLLIEFSENFRQLFLSQLRQAILNKTRDFIRGDIHKTVKYIPPIVSPDRKPGRDLIKSPFTMQEFEISASIYDMINMLKDHLRVYPEDVALPQHAFNVYLAIVSIPKHESDPTDLVPLSAALICNNCWYLSHHAAITFRHVEDKVPLLRTKADQAFSFLMRSIRTKLNLMISNAMVGLDEKVNGKKDCSLDFMVIASELHRLHEIFKNVLPLAVWEKGLAILVDHTVNEMVTKVLSWDDISASTANELAASFIKFAVETSHLFKGEATSVREIDALTSKAVSKWQRFRLLTFVLTASMSEIGDKWVGGCGPLAAEFTADEVRKLVRALFQNTDRRATFLASIK